MAKFVKIILFLLLAMTIHCVADNLFTDKPVKGETTTHIKNVKSSEISKPEFPFLPEGELASAAQNYQGATSNRVLRTSMKEYSLTLRMLVQKILLREAALAQHWGRIYDTTVSYCCCPASEYYVFALRRIII